MATPTILSATPRRTAPAGVDPRGLRVGAWLTTIILAVVLITGSGWLLAAQAIVFALGAILGPRRSPYGLLYARLLRPRLGPPADLEDPTPPRFAQTVGLAFSVVGVVGFATGLTVLGLIAAGLALMAALLNAAFGLCLGCEMYLLWARSRSRLHHGLSAGTAHPAGGRGRHSLLTPSTTTIEGSHS